MTDRKYDSTIARMAWNIAVGIIPALGSSPYNPDFQEHVAAISLRIARHIVRLAELPPPPPANTPVSKG